MFDLEQLNMKSTDSYVDFDVFVKFPNFFIIKDPGIQIILFGTVSDS